jgi:nucleoid DNA-binding protein
MNKSDLVRSVAHELNLPVQKANIYVDTFFDVLSEGLCRQHRAELRGFGTFILRRRKPRQGVDPRTRKPLIVPAKTIVAWRTSVELRERVDSSPL